MSLVRRSSLGSVPALLFTIATGAGAQTPPPRPAAPAPARPAVAQPGAPTPPAGVPTPASPGDSKALKAWAELLESMKSGTGLTSDEVARRARSSSTELEAKRYAIRAAEADVDRARFGFWPRLTLSAGYTRLSAIEAPTLGDFGGGGSLVVTPSQPGVLDPATDPLVAVTPPEISFEPVLDNYTFAAQLAVPLSDYVLRMSDTIAAASHVKDANVYQQVAIAAAVDRDARVTYYEWIRAQAFQLIAEQAREQAEGHLKDAQNGFQAGLFSKADVMQAQARLGNAQLSVERAKNATELRRVGLAVAMHDSSGVAYVPGENVFAEAPELSRLPAASAAYREAIGKRAELKALIENEKAFQKQAATERVNRYPRLDAQASALYANPNPRFFPQEEKFDGTWEIGAVLSWTPTDIGGANAASGAAEARARELAAQRRGLQDGIRVEVENALVEAAQARYAIEVSATTLAAAEESYRVRQELFRAGRATFTELQDALTEFTRARLELANSHIAARIALTQLHHAMGRDQQPQAR